MPAQNVLAKAESRGRMSPAAEQSGISASARRVAVIIPSLHGGGCERVVAALLHELVRRYDVDLILTNRVLAYPLPASLRIVDLAIDPSNNLPPIAKVRRLVRRIFALRRQLWHSDYDLILSFLDLNNVCTFWANRLRRRPAPHIAVEQTVCEGFFTCNPTARRFAPLFRMLLRHVYRRVDRLVVLSKTMAQFLAAELGVDRPMDVVYNGVSAGDFANGEGEGAGELPREFHQATVRIVNVGRLELPQKNQLLLLDVFVEIRRRCPGAELFLIGEGPDEQRIKEHIRLLALDDAVHLTGWRNDLPAIFSRADLMLHCANYETFGNVLLESLACRLPVLALATDPVIDELLADFPNANILRRATPEGIADAACRLLIQPPDPLEREAGRARVLRDFSMAATVAAYLNCIADTLAAQSGSGRSPK